MIANFLFGRNYCWLLCVFTMFSDIILVFMFLQKVWGSQARRLLGCLGRGCTLKIMLVWWLEKRNCSWLFCVFTIFSEIILIYMFLQKLWGSQARRLFISLDGGYTWTYNTVEYKKKFRVRSTSSILPDGTHFDELGVENFGRGPSCMWLKITG